MQKHEIEQKQNQKQNKLAEKALKQRFNADSDNFSVAEIPHVMGALMLANSLFTQEKSGEAARV